MDKKIQELEALLLESHEYATGLEAKIEEVEKRERVHIKEIFILDAKIKELLGVLKTLERGLNQWKEMLSTFYKNKVIEEMHSLVVRTIAAYKGEK